MARDVKSIADLPNLGPASARMLAEAGITSVSQLRKLGAAAAFLMVQQAGLRPSRNLLWAMEGALTGRHWLKLTESDRERLLRQVDLTCD
jgi:DNA transformation protein